MKYLIILLMVWPLACTESVFKSNKTADKKKEAPSEADAVSEVIAETEIEMSEEPSSAAPVVLPEIELEVSEQGLIGGHFDVDTSTQIYELGEGETDGHVHEYDDKYQVNGVNFLAVLNDELSNLQDVIPAGVPFILHVVNGNLSPGAVIEVNNRQQYANVYNEDPGFAKVTYIFSPDDVAGRLKSFSVRFKKDALAGKGLIGTGTDCVRSNEPGKNNEYRNGALLVQALDAGNYEVDPVYGQATKGLLWEGAIFWHHDDGCFE
ncbi:MAG: hypothetical protein HRU19_24860 [Pseudobacteriovorax sp.]|nr:hypothetical protein [Pseudobacteriovorax sp.]